MSAITTSWTSPTPSATSTPRTTPTVWTRSSRSSRSWLPPRKSWHACDTIAPTSRSSLMHVHQALAQALHDHDVHELFGVVGDANLFIIDSFRTAAGGRYVPTSTEANAVMAAFGYAQVSGKLGVATVTHGPGLTNTVTALIEAQRGRVPMLVLAGDTPVS